VGPCVGARRAQARGGRAARSRPDARGRDDPRNLGLRASVSHTPPRWPRTTFVDGVEAAIAKAREIAGDKDVTVASANVIQQSLELGLVDEVCVSLVPVLFGEGSHTSPSWTAVTCCSRTRSWCRDAAPSTSDTRSVADGQVSEGPPALPGPRTHIIMPPRGPRSWAVRERPMAQDPAAPLPLSDWMRAS
jgi:hypothetical protein